MIQVGERQVQIAVSTNPALHALFGRSTRVE
jgi:hypothetical protein